MGRLKTVGLIALGLVVGAFLVAQLVPYRVDNPPVTQQADWVNAEVEALAKKACFDCHSNEMKNPWYGNIAPASWLVTKHVVDARSKLNFSELDKPQKDAHEAGEIVLEGEMPPTYYKWLHPEAALTDAERETLSKGLDITLKPHFRKSEKHDE